jgi:hypothetical protein
MKEREKKKAAELKAKERRRKEYEKLKKEFGDTFQTGTRALENRCPFWYNSFTIKRTMTENYPDYLFEEAERRELINEALIELDAIVLGGQDTREFYLSVSHIRNVLERLK